MCNIAVLYCKLGIYFIFGVYYLQYQSMLSHCLGVTLAIRTRITVKSLSTFYSTVSIILIWLCRGSDKNP